MLAFFGVSKVMHSHITHTRARARAHEVAQSTMAVRVLRVLRFGTAGKPIDHLLTVLGCIFIITTLCVSRYSRNARMWLWKTCRSKTLVVRINSYLRTDLHLAYRVVSSFFK